MAKQEKIDDRYKFKLTPKQKKAIKRNKEAIEENLLANGLYKEPFITMGNRWIEMLITCYELEEDIQLRGVQVYDLGRKTFKKNDSVSLLTNTNKQMLILLRDLNISADKVDKEEGQDL